VRAGHCADPADWRWGSYRALAGLERPVDFLDIESVHDVFDSARAYRSFVLSGIERLGSDPYRGQTPDCSLRPAIHSAKSGSTKA
jgi:hypothetical protein